MISLTDIIFAIATIGFTYATIPQYLKLRKLGTANDISFTHHKITFVACILMDIGYLISGLYISLIPALIQTGIRIMVMRQIVICRRK